MRSAPPTDRRRRTKKTSGDCYLVAKGARQMSGRPTPGQTSPSARLSPRQETFPPVSFRETTTFDFVSFPMIFDSWTTIAVDDPQQGSRDHEYEKCKGGRRILLERRSIAAGSRQLAGGSRPVNWSIGRSVELSNNGSRNSDRWIGRIATGSLRQ